MKLAQRTAISLLAVALVMLTAGVGAAQQDTTGLLPEGLRIEDTYQPGFGNSVGQLDSVEGDVIVIHRDAPGTGYRGQLGAALYRGDTVITLKGARAQIRLGDDSRLSMASEAKLVILKSFVDAAKGRSTFLGVSLGKIRFLIRKLMGEFKVSEFEVKTRTAVAGVRGSDFVIEASELACTELPGVPELLRQPGELCAVTDIITLDDTVLAVSSLATPEIQAVTMVDRQLVRVVQGGPVPEPQNVPPERIEQLRQELKVTAQAAPQPEENQKAQQKAQQKADSAQPATGTAGRDDPTQPSGLVGAGEELQIQISAEDLFEPEDPIDTGGLEELVIEEVIETQAAEAQEQTATEVQDQVSEDQIEEEVREALPGFPGAPE
ncbi:MAG: FecR family protein [Deferrisomatales bacterium]|nr:FecR family protein [Deferrisomatales bacterium]